MAGPGDGAVVAPAIPGPGGKQQWLRQCSPAWIPIPLRAKVWPRRTCHHALEQWLMGQEVCREQGSFSFCFPPYLPNSWQMLAQPPVCLGALVPTSGSLQAGR